MTDEKEATEESNEGDARKAQLIRNLVVVAVFGSAIAFGFFIELPVFSFGKDKKEQVSKDEKEIREALNAENRLTLTTGV